MDTKTAQQGDCCVMNSFIHILKQSVVWPMYPVGATSLLLLVGATLLLSGSKKAGTFFILAAGILLFVFCLPWTGFTLLHRLEAEAGSYGDPARLRAAGVRYIVVLNNGLASTSRLLEGIRLWREMPDTKLVLSRRTLNSVDARAGDLRFFGVPREALLILEPQALDTADEVARFKPIIGSEPFALVTSAFHMPRAVQLFRAKGARPIPCPCEFDNSRLSTYELFIPSFGSLEYSKLALHEYYGRLFYWIKGLAPSSFE
jgi:uncharacterized SAM-binding protein YcdF (DUF218 family)